ncbi:hypothetical protein LUZ61_012548 [Rhynchospora tenuis]|uniref:Dirigent protein n=1 Tax=Rhynchospora tenuis TaxID=198213 RepID=A0AAD6A3A0_9POAL|nr:hypothetical protein LUZ61_012548 [Rhynchospora tenuis]
MNPDAVEISNVENELQILLYLHHISSGPNRNQLLVKQPDGPGSFGSMLVHDWQLTEGLDVNGKVIARAQGIHVQASLDREKRIWFKGSTLEVKGTYIAGGQWSIVGGTGEFANAKGVIYIGVSNVSNGNGTGHFVCRSVC